MIKKSLVLDIMKQNYKRVILFEIIMKFIILLMIIPILVLTVNSAMKLSDITYLSYDNIQHFLTRPELGIVLVIVAIVFGFFITFEIMALTGAYHASFYHVKIKTKDMFNFAILNFKKLFRKNNFLLVLLILLLIPLLLLPQFIMINYAKMPWYIKNYIGPHKTFLTILFLVLLGASAYLIKMGYAIFYMCTEDEDFISACKRSINLIRNDYFKTVFGLIGWNICITVISSIVLVVTVGIIYFIGKFIGASEIIRVVTINSYIWVLAFLIIIIVLLTMPTVIAFLITCYYKQKVDIGEQTDNYVKPKNIFKDAHSVKRWYSLVAVILVILNIGILVTKDGPLTVNTALFHKTSITGHRGDSHYAPENTLASVQYAIDHYADYAEIDVQQTKDGQIIVMHDSNLKRTTGWDKDIWKVTYDQIKDLDAGGWFSEKFKGEKIPTLDEVIKLAKGKIKLNIELKPTGHERGFEDSVVNIIKDNNFEKNCVVTSLMYDTISRVKQIDPDLKTIYVTTLVYGDIAKVKYIDGFSVHHSFVTEKLVRSVKEQGKLLFVWTVNNEKDLKKMLKLGVDNIITDDPIRTRRILYSNYAPDKLVEIVDKRTMKYRNNTNE